MPDPVTVTTMHRWFAVECNNRAWDITSQSIRTPADERELLQCAYAAAYHWERVGTPLNEARADALLAQAHALCGHGDLALHYARRCLEFCEHHECEPWDRAFAHLVLTHAAGVHGDRGLRDQHRAQAERLGQKLPDEGERRQFEGELGKLNAREQTAASPGPGNMEG